jgi:hypothetical protein
VGGGGEGVVAIGDLELQAASKTVVSTSVNMMMCLLNIPLSS